MASTSKDDNRYENDPGTESPGKIVGGKPTRNDSEVEREDTGSAPLTGEPSDIVKDEELIEMLEQLSDTIDTAQTILTDNQMLGSDDEPATLQTAVDAPPPQEQPARAGRKTLSTATSLGIGICLGVGTLGAFWLHANWPRYFSGDQLSKDQPPAAASVVARKSEETPEPEAAILEAKQPDEITAVPALVEKPEPEAASPEAKQTDEIVAVPALPAVSAPPQSAVDASSHERTTVNTTSPETPTSASGTTKSEKPKGVNTARTEKPPAPPPLDADEEARLLKKGKKFSLSGDIASARLVYEHAANRGSAEAMYALAQTYDPRMLAKWKVIGIAPDATAAIGWYTRAARLGHNAADVRAHELEQQLKR